MKNTIALNLRFARERAKISQKEAAEITGYTERHIQRLEAEGTESLRVIHILAEAYGSHPARLIFSPEEYHLAALALIPVPIKSYFFGPKSEEIDPPDE